MACTQRDDCTYCTKALKQGQIGFCSDTCRKKETAKQARMASAKPGENRCRTCGGILTGYGNKRNHTGECHDIAHLKRCKKYTRKHMVSRPWIDKVCGKCGKPFKTRYPDQPVCSEQKCQNAQQRQRRKLAYAKMTVEQKKEYVKKIRESDAYGKENYKTKTVKVKAKCPGCGKIFMAKMENAYLDVVMPRIKCNNWPACIKHIDGGYHFPDMVSGSCWQGDNRGMI